MESVLGKITVIQIADLGKIRFMNLRLDQKENLVQFVGPNEAGKSTVLDSLQNLFQSAANIPEGIIRKGLYTEGVKAGAAIDRGLARVETSKGYIIERIVRLDKNGKQVAELKVLFNGAPVQGGPLKFLQSVSTKYPDPHKVSNLTEAELFEELSGLIRFNFKIYDDEIERLKEDSRDKRAMLKALGAEVKRPEGEKPEIIPGKSLPEMLKEAEPMRELLERRRKNYAEAAATWDEGLKKIEEFNEWLKGFEAWQMEIMAKGFNRNTPPKDEVLEALEKEIKAAAGNSEAIKLWTDYETDSTKRKTLQDGLFKNDQASMLQEQKKWDDFLQSAESLLPAGTVSLTNEKGVVRSSDGMPWGTLSHASRLTLASHLCMATIPQGAIRAVYIERGESIGTEKKAIIAKVAEEYDVQVFMEVFSESGEKGDGIFLLEEGEVIFPENQVAASVSSQTKANELDWDEEPKPENAAQKPNDPPEEKPAYAPKPDMDLF